MSLIGRCLLFNSFEIVISMSEESVKVFVRIRPLTQKEIQKERNDIILPDTSEKQLTLKDVNPQRNNHRVFAFDDVFPTDTPQPHIFESTSLALTQDVLQGYNGTVFAYGQTGSGKTHTMMGDFRDPEHKGLIPRCFESILEAAKSDTSKDYLIMCSYVQLYNQELRDLLHFHDKTKLQLRQCPQKGVFIKDLKKVPVTSLQEMMKYIKVGNSNRTTAQTQMNTESSRSHSIFTIYVESLEKKEDQIEKLVGSKFNLVDLAGSERQSKTGSIGDRFLEATKINLSLTALGKVISALVEGKNSYIPYRDSKLTRLLQDSLGGNSKTVMIATVSPWGLNYEETLSTLKYASRAKYITNVPIINLDPKDALLKEYEQQIVKLRQMLSDIQKEDQPALDSLIQENKRIAMAAEEQKKELIEKIKSLEQKFISTPFQLPNEYRKERKIREQKLSFMTKNYQNLQDEVKEMKEQLSDLRKKYKAASKEIFQMENQHEKEREIIQEEFSEIKMENIMLRSVLNVLFSQKQLKNIISLGEWESNSKFKLPSFYFKDRHTLAFPCEDEQNQNPARTAKMDSRGRSSDKYQTSTSFGAKAHQNLTTNGIAYRRR